MVISRRVAALLLLAGGFQWLVWPNFLRVVWRDDRAFDDAGGPTAFLIVHVAIVVPALLLGTALLVLGAVAWRRAPRAEQQSGRTTSGGGPSTPRAQAAVAVRTSPTRR